MVRNLGVIGQTFVEMQRCLLEIPLMEGDVVVVTNAIFSIPLIQEYLENTWEENSFLCFHYITCMHNFCKSKKARMLFVRIASVSSIYNPNNWETKLQILDYQEENRKSGKYVSVDSKGMYLQIDWKKLGILCVAKGIEYYDTQEEMNCKRKKEIFFDWLHLTPWGNEVVAKYLFDCIFLQDIYQDQYDSIDRMKSRIESSDIMEIERYIEEVTKQLQFDYSTGVGGCIIANANPFTIGHRYLVEKALDSVDWLIVFVLEEDKSAFGFAERLELVKRGTADLKNVAVVRSGQFIISHSTFPEYFNKDELQNEIIDAGKDIEFFGKYIAPKLNIRKRFVGEEPFCKVTRQYNEQMKLQLPIFDIELVIIPRLEIKGVKVSASHVRKLIGMKKFEDLKDIIPISSLEYVIENNEIVNGKKETK